MSTLSPGSDPAASHGIVATERSTLRGPRVTIRLDNIATNYRRIRAEVGGGALVGAVVKANAYGHGAAPVANVLHGEGCRHFFVARVGEGLTVRAALAEAGCEAAIYVFDGIVAGCEPDLAAGDLVPIANSLEQVERWQHYAASSGQDLPFGLHFDTGMRRLGLCSDEQARFAAEPARWTAGIDWRLAISHLASADVDGSNQSDQQGSAFRALLTNFDRGTAPPLRSLANSAGVFLGSSYHMDLVRPGISLYGGSPHPDSDKPNPMLPGAVLEAPIVQIRTAASGESVGYGATFVVDRETTVATIAMGYADGFLRSASNAGSAIVAGRRVPIIGRVSMDLITLDVTDVPAAEVSCGQSVELIGPNLPIDEVADAAATVPHEFVTCLNPRLERRYVMPRDTGG